MPVSAMYLVRLKIPRKMEKNVQKVVKRAFFSDHQAIDVPGGRASRHHVHRLIGRTGLLGWIVPAG